jgi:hypothetical protein
MEQHETVYVFASREVQGLLADSETDLVELLNREGLPVRRGFARDPAHANDAGHKEPTSVILVSAALVAALTPTLAKIIAALSHKAVAVEEEVAVPLEDSTGRVVRGAAGEPVIHWVKRARIVESTEKPQEQSSWSIKGLGLRIDFKTTPTG